MIIKWLVQTHYDRLHLFFRASLRTDPSTTLLSRHLLVLQIKAIRQVCSPTVGRGQAVLGQDVAGFLGEDF